MTGKLFGWEYIISETINSPKTLENFLERKTKLVEEALFLLRDSDLGQ